MSGRRILIFDAYSGGHRGQYIRMLLDYWVGHALSGEIVFMLPPDFQKTDPAVVEFARSHQGSGIRYEPIREREIAHKSSFDFIRRDFRHGEMIREAIEEVRPDHCLLMYFDHAQLSLWRDLSFDSSVDISGIYFRPSFHYSKLGSPPPSLADRFQRIRKRLMLGRALTNRNLHTVFSLDPFAVDHINRIADRDVAVFLPDGVPLSSGPDRKNPLPQAAERRTALLFGGLNERKGLFRVLESIHELPNAAQQKLRLVLAGPIPEDEHSAVTKAIAMARSSTEVDIYLEDRYIPIDDVHTYMCAADVVLVAYQHHIGSSNVLIRAAEAERPVIGSNYGVVGEQIRRRKLGLAVDTSSSRMLADAICRFVERPHSIPFNAESARRVANENSAEAFARTIFSRILG